MYVRLWARTRLTRLSYLVQTAPYRAGNIEAFLFYRANMYCTDGYELTVLHILNLFIEKNEAVKVFGNSGGALSYSIAGGGEARKGRK